VNKPPKIKRFFGREQKDKKVINKEGEKKKKPSSWWKGGSDGAL